MVARIERRFERLAAERRAGLVTYIMAGDPDPETSLALLKALPGAGADVVEFGMAFTDPMADGPPVQAAGLRALRPDRRWPRHSQWSRRFASKTTRRLSF